MMYDRGGTEDHQGKSRCLIDGTKTIGCPYGKKIEFHITHTHCTTHLHTTSTPHHAHHTHHTRYSPHLTLATTHMHTTLTTLPTPQQRIKDLNIKVKPKKLKHIQEYHYGLR